MEQGASLIGGAAVTPLCDIVLIPKGATTLLFMERLYYGIY